MKQTHLAEHEKVFLRLLNDHQVEYLVIGGHAVAYHGYRRPIGDLDVWISTRTDNARKVVAVMHAFGNGLPAEAETIFELPERVIRIGTPPHRMDRFQDGDRFIHLGSMPPLLEVMTSISGVEFVECYLHRVTGDLDGVPVNFIGLNCLIENKKASIRPKDADDHAHLTRNQAGAA